MNTNTAIYIGILIGIIINIWSFFKKPSNNKIRNDELLSKNVKIANYIIIFNIAFSIISTILKQTGILSFDFMITMFISFVLILISSLFGAGEILIRMILTRIHTPEVFKTALPKVRLRLFLQFAMFVFGSVWCLSDSLITFTWLDFFSKLVSFEPFQDTPAIGIGYFALIYLNSVFKITDIFSFRRISFIKKNHQNNN